MASSCYAQKFDMTLLTNPTTPTTQKKTHQKQIPQNHHQTAQDNIVMNVFVSKIQNQSLNIFLFPLKSHSSPLRTIPKTPLHHTF